jgi:NADH-quinone oxidoreductase subunit A
LPIRKVSPLSSSAYPFTAKGICKSEEAFKQWGLADGSQRRNDSLNAAPGQAIALWPLALYAAAVLGLVASMLILSWLLGQRHRGRETGEPYESGVAPTGSARLRLSASFYLIAMFFVIFDLEAAFIVAWAVAIRELGWPGYIGVLAFIGVLTAALLYEWRLGALDWESRSQRPRAVHWRTQEICGDGHLRRDGAAEVAEKRS